MTAAFTKLTETFERDDESPLSGSGWDATSVDLVDGVVVAAAPRAAALRETTTPDSADVKITAGVASAVEDIAATAISSVAGTGTAVLTFTLAAVHGRPSVSVGRVTLAGFTSTGIDVNGAWNCTFSSTADITIDFGTIPSISVNGTIVSADCYVGLLGRIPTGTSTADFQPTDGYALRLAYRPSGVRELHVLRVDPGGGYMEAVTTATVTSLETDIGTASDLTVLQDLRLTIVTSGNLVTVRGYVNNDDDEAPDIIYADRGSGLADTSDYSPTTKAAGTWGFEIGAGQIAIENFYAEDRYELGSTDTAAGVTLKEIRQNVRRELTRGTDDSVIDDATLDYHINEAQFEVKSMLGDLVWNLQRAEQLTLAFDGNHNTDLPDNIERLHDLYHANSLTRVPHAQLGGTTSGGMRLHVPAGPTTGTQTYEAIYVEKWRPLSADSDACALPRQYTSLVVLHTVSQLTSRNTDPAWRQSIEARFARKMRSTKYDLNRIRTSEHSAFRVPRARNARGRWRYAPSGDPRLLWPSI